MSSAVPPRHSESVTIPFRARSGRQQQFLTLFREGMELVEETANYLDGPGRAAAKALSPYVALSYATESMRLTTRLTQLASWLLARRAVFNGETLPHAGSLNDPLLLPPLTRTNGAKAYDELPVELRDLIAQSYQLHEKVYRFDATEHATPTVSAKAAVGRPNGVAAQVAMLQAEFVGRG
jgi:regulator of CtrA degradation